MKYILLILIIFLSTQSHAIGLANTPYGRVTSSYAYLYQSPNQKINDNVICYLEESYFVEIVLDYNSDFYQANYNGINGFVLKKNIKKVLGTPTKPYPTTNLTTISNKCYLRSSPDSNANNIVAVVPENNTDLKYIGKIYGEEAIDYRGNLWYLVDFYGVKGYIYNQYVASIEPISINLEVLDEFSQITSTPSPLSNTDCAIVIAILSIPVIIIIIVMYKKPKPSKTAKTTKKIKNPRKIKKIDYDELL